jgi:glutaredoxin 3
MKEVRLTQIHKMLGKPMSARKKIEVFSAGCSTCGETIEIVKKIAGSARDVVIHDMHQADLAPKRKSTALRACPPWSLMGPWQDAAPDMAQINAFCVPLWPQG